MIKFVNDLRQFDGFKLEYTERTTDHGQSTGKLYHLRLRIECTFFVTYMNPHRIGDRLVAWMQRHDDNYYKGEQLV
jgi:hypothetical protein